MLVSAPLSSDTLALAKDLGVAVSLRFHWGTVMLCAGLLSRSAPVQASQHVKICLSNTDTWEASDFPSDPPRDCGLSLVEYQSFKARLLHRPILQRRGITDAQLRAQGCRSWKQYLLRLYLSNE